MSKLNKQAEVFEKITEMIKNQQEKQASPAAKAESIALAIAKEQERAKNEVTPESLNSKQKDEQKAAIGYDPSDPVKKVGEDITIEAKKENEPIAHEAKEDADKAVKKMPPIPGDKKAEDESAVAKLGQEILDAVTKMAAKAAPAVSVSKATDHVNQNSIKPELLNSKQKQEQKPSTDPADPTKNHKHATDEDAEKIASYQLGVMLAEEYNRIAHQEKLAVYKEAGKRDLENMIAKAATALEKETKPVAVKQAQEVEVSPEQVKQAEEAGAQAFKAILKQAEAQAAQENISKQADAEKKVLSDKIAVLETEKQEILKQALEKIYIAEQKIAVKEAEEKENEKMARWADVITRNTIEQIRQELLKSNA